MLTNAEVSAQSTKHAAWVASGAAILAAIIAFGGTWWSTERAAKAASDTVTQQVSGETDKSRAEFLRGQRQALYSRIIADERKLSKWRMARSGRIIRSGKKFDRIKVQLAQLQTHTPTAEIVASPAAGEQLANLIDVHLRIIREMLGPK